jgi:putative hydrolase of the HAD superfamily
VERYLEQHRIMLMQPDPEVMATLEELRSAGFRLALVSNCVPEEAALLERSSFYPLFDCVIASCRIGHIKPEREIYAAACSALSVLPEACWFIGDGAFQELAGAKRLRMTTVLVTGFISPEEQELGRSQEPDHSIRHVSQLRALLAMTV